MNWAVFSVKEPTVLLRIAVAFVLLAAPALAADRSKPESFDLRTDKSERAGSVVPRGSDGKTYDIYDTLGRRQGTVTREGINKDWVIRDTLGRRQGRVIERQR
ncbi:hypothetical protein [Azospirillum canadense]|uniref:hypothetical protein n=1 Tax=Azospirillum canadense TaxID=403962 RepID=UPI002225EF96|nr:hypothetical protein [Azospirillum canadense]MCW2237479.1 hypothetical protein [Azospirillum canadense]